MVNPLARVIMEKDLKTGGRTPSPSSNRSANLGRNEGELISNLINGGKEVRQNVERKGTISLDDAVDKIKNNR